MSVTTSGRIVWGYWCNSSLSRVKNTIRKIKMASLWQWLRPFTGQKKNDRTDNINFGLAMKCLFLTHLSWVWWWRTLSPPQEGKRCPDLRNRCLENGLLKKSYCLTSSHWFALPKINLVSLYTQHFSPLTATSYSCHSFLPDLARWKKIPLSFNKHTERAVLG